MVEALGPVGVHVCRSGLLGSWARIRLQASDAVGVLGFGVLVVIRVKVQLMRTIGFRVCSAGFRE